jgi:hypothetical protein
LPVFLSLIGKWMFWIMSICKLCGKDKTYAASCLSIFDDQIPFGEEIHEIQGVSRKTKRCLGCGVKMGGFHHLNCEMEECPKCHDQHIYCECEKATKLEASKWKNVLNAMINIYIVNVKRQPSWRPWVTTITKRKNAMSWKRSQKLCGVYNLL